MHNVQIYTDGACSGNPGAGGYAAILMCNGKTRVISGAKQNTTNNQMELMAVIEGLNALNKPCIVEIFSDSAYVVNAFNQGWIEMWIKNGWRTSSRKAVQNVDLWKRLIELTKTHIVTFHKVKGHADNKFNNRCDELARNAINNL
jgi:ribonuclease HI